MLEPNAETDESIAVHHYMIEQAEQGILISQKEKK